MNWQRPVAAILGFGALAAIVAGGADFDLWAKVRKKEAPAALIDWKPGAEKAAAAPGGSSVGLVQNDQPRWGAPEREPDPEPRKAGSIPFESPKLGSAGGGSRPRPEVCSAAGRWLIRLSLTPGQQAVFDQDAPVIKLWCPEAHPWHSAKARLCYATEDCCRQQGWDCSQPTRVEPLPESLAEARRR